MSTQHTLLNFLTMLKSGEGGGIDGSIYKIPLLRIKNPILDKENICGFEEKLVKCLRFNET